MNATSLGPAMRRFAAIALVLALAPITRGTVADPGAAADQAAARQTVAPAVMLAQGRCNNGRCR